MTEPIKNLIKMAIPKILLKKLRPFYHSTLSLLASRYYRYPSRKLIIIGVTGTNGKTTTVNLIAKILETAGYKVGFTSTVNVNIDGTEHLNKQKMTMPSGLNLQKWLAQMVARDCQYAVIEVSSEGLAQGRHLGINFDVAVFTNLTPEHLESHGGFENYKKAKAILFQTLTKHSITEAKKKINPSLQKTIVANIDDEFGKYYLNFKADRHITYGVKTNNATYVAKDVKFSPQGLQFSILYSLFSIHLKGQFDVYNSLAAISTTASLGVPLETAKQALEKINVIPGRVEVLKTSPFTVVVDYAYEPEEMRQLYETVNRWPHKNIIQVLGPCGGGRDHARIGVLGDMAARFAHMVIVTTDDPYDDDPKLMGEEMCQHAASQGKTINENLFIELDRRKAIAKALLTATPGDIVLITGKGADQKMALADGFYAPWDDRTVAREELSRALSSRPPSRDPNS